MESAAADLRDGLGNPVITTDLKKVKALAKEDVEKLVKKLGEKDLKPVVKAVEEIGDNDLGAMGYSIFDFVGFDPFSIIAVIKIICDHYKDPEEVMLSDIRFCIAACLYMGNIQSKALTKRAAEGRAKIEFLALKYNMMQGTTQSGLSAETLTFPRVAASFPVLAIRMANQIKPKAVNLEFQSGLIPGCMRLTPFASLCSPLMKEGARVFLMEACNAHGSDMSIAYEKGRLKKAKKEVKYDPVFIAGEQWAFVDVASSSPVPSEESKKSLLTKLNVVQYYDDLATVVKNYRAITQKKKLDDVTVIDKKEFESQVSEYISS